MVTIYYIILHYTPAMVECSYKITTGGSMNRARIKEEFKCRYGIQELISLAGAIDFAEHIAKLVTEYNDCTIEYEQARADDWKSQYESASKALVDVAKERDALQGKLDSGVRVMASNGAHSIVATSNEHVLKNATLIIDYGVIFGS